DAVQGTVLLFEGDGRGGFHPAAQVAVGEGASNLAFLGSSQPDLIISNQIDNLVRRVPNRGCFAFGPAVPYQTSDAWYSTRQDGAQPASLVSFIETTDMAVGHFTANGEPGVVALNRGYYSLGLLAGLGERRLANAKRVPLDFPA